MVKYKDTLVTVIGLVLIGSLLLIWLKPAPLLTHAPDITVTDLDGNSITLSKLRGHPLLVNFWATTCTGCLEEMPHLIELYAEQAPRGFEIIGITMDYDPPKQVIALSKARQIPYPIALDTHGEAAKAFGKVRLTPTTFLVAPDGRIVFQKTGKIDMGKLRTLVLGMLGQP